MITLRILLSPGRRGRVVDASGRSIPQPVPAPVIGSSEPLRIILLDPSTLDPADPYGFDTGAPLRLTISGDWDPATIPVYATNDLVRASAGVYDLADPSGTRTAEALALLGVLAERLCAWELTAYGGDPATEADWAHPLSVVQFDAPLRQRADSLGGDPAEAPAVDLRGPPGPPGKDAEPSDADPSMDGAASAGSSDKCSRGDHVHPSDTSRVAKVGDTMTGSLTVSGEESSVEVAPGYFRITSDSDVTTFRKDRIQKRTGSLLRDIRLPNNGGVVALQQAIAPEFSTGSTYAVGAYCTHDGLLYRCTSAVSIAGDWNASNWSAVCIVDEMGGGGASYYEVEYLESNGMQYVDTGVTAGLGVRVVAEVEWDSLATNDQAFGSARYYSGYSNRWFVGVAADSTGYVSAGADASYINPKTPAVAVTTGARYTYDYTVTASAATLLINGNSAFSQSGTFSFANPFPIFAFARNASGTAENFSRIKLYSLKIYSGDVLVRDFVPVRSGFDGALLDRVTGAFFTNAGAGAFVIGPDK